MNERMDGWMNDWLTKLLCDFTITRQTNQNIVFKWLLTRAAWAIYWAPVHRRHLNKINKCSLCTCIRNKKLVFFTLRVLSTWCNAILHYDYHYYHQHDHQSNVPVVVAVEVPLAVFNTLEQVVVLLVLDDDNKLQVCIICCYSFVLLSHTRSFLTTTFTQFPLATVFCELELELELGCRLKKTELQQHWIQLVAVASVSRERERERVACRNMRIFIIII